MNVGELVTWIGLGAMVFNAGAQWGLFLAEKAFVKKEFARHSADFVEYKSDVKADFAKLEKMVERCRSDWAHSDHGLAEKFSAIESLIRDIKDDLGNTNQAIARLEERVKKT